MPPRKNTKTGPENFSEKRKDRAAEVANTLEWLITAFILAFVFRAFVMEAFRIPTGSMADTLKGAHFRLRCPQCGYKYDYGFIPRYFGYSRDDYIPPPGNLAKLYPSRCPSCGHYQKTGGTMPVANGDRILVLKCLYQFFEPKRWDIIVFKNPTEPSINYIKRLVGHPKEKVEIIDGDVYIDDQISRKPAKVQEEMWTPVYNNDYQPVQPRNPLTRFGFNNNFWQQPFKNLKDSNWVLDDINEPTQFRLDSPADQLHCFFYDTSAGNDFRAVYAYDDVRTYLNMPYCSDLMVRFYVNTEKQQGRIGIALSKYQSTYTAWIDFTGEMVITKTSEDQESILNSKSIEVKVDGKPTLVKFANADHKLVLQFGSEELTFDLGRGRDDTGPRKTGIQPQVKVFGSGKLTLSHIALFRDIHYTAKKYANSNDSGRATEGNPLILGEDEFFVLGDNSPNSEDGRWWSSPGVANGGNPPYREGIVPRDYLIGKALFVYWPQGFKLFYKDRLGIIPNIGQMRFIYGGSRKIP